MTDDKTTDEVIVNGIKVSPEMGDIIVSLMLGAQRHSKKQYLKGLMHGALSAAVGVLLWYAYGPL